jgi:anaerobic glycerol-3-phosphate dehydrogenase
VGLKGNPDLDPVLACSALKRTCPSMPCRPYRVDPGLPSSINAGSGTALTEEASATVERLAGVLQELHEEVAALPPLFVGANCERAWSALERSSGRQVREPMTPLSSPGRRLQACLEDGAVEAGATLWAGRELVGLELGNGGIATATLRSGLRMVSVRPKALLLATGNLVAGGLAVQGEGAIDPLGLFAVTCAEGPGVASPVLRRCLSAGLGSVGGRAVLIDGTVAANAWVAGSAVSGLSYPSGSGLGLAMADAWTKAELVREAL